MFISTKGIIGESVVKGETAVSPLSPLTQQLRDGLPFPPFNYISDQTIS
ncbi:MAG: hypothetical protein GY805_01200 [Chloroflexi bacterium]|nr:hypothetical protein [Chloroflexota bacterium]